MSSCFMLGNKVTIQKSKGGGGNALSMSNVRPRANVDLVVGRPHIPISLICVDTTDKVELASRAIQKCLDQASFNEVKLLTHEHWRPYAVKIPRLQGLSGYSNFMIRELNQHVNSSHALIVQWDGYIVDSQRWRKEFLAFDYIGAPWFQWNGSVGNGGFSLRSKRLLDVLAKHPFGDEPHPEDNYICLRHRGLLELSHNIKFAPTDMAAMFAIETRTYDGHQWQGGNKAWDGHFGFHSYLTPLPEDMDRPLVFHHGGDLGDVIYALPTIKALGGGVLFLSPDNRHPYPHAPHGPINSDWAGNLAPLLNEQDYIWQCLYTGTLPFSTDCDLNAFRDYYRNGGPENWRSILSLHLKRFGVGYDESQPWLKVREPFPVPGRPIVVNRTQRYQHDYFPWGDLVQRYGDQMVFIGSNAEWELFKGFRPNKPVPRHDTPHLLDVARVIAGAKVFIGNQSAPMAIALGLGQNVIQEVWPGNPNCMISRTNAIYWKGGSTPTIPQEWLT